MGDLFSQFLKESDIVFPEQALSDKLSIKLLNQYLNGEKELPGVSRLAFVKLFFRFCVEKASEVKPKKVNELTRRLAYRFIGMLFSAVSSVSLARIETVEAKNLSINLQSFSPNVVFEITDSEESFSEDYLVACDI